MSMSNEDKTKAVEAVQGKFEEVFGDTSDEYGEGGEDKQEKISSPASKRAQAEEEDDEMEEEDDDELQEDDDDSSEDADEEAEQDEEPEESKGGDLPELTLDSVLRHAARRSGMSDEEIDAFYEAQPELAEKTFTRLHQSQNDLSMRYAKLGQQKLGGEEPDTSPARSGEAKPTKKQARSLLEKIYGDELGKIEEDFGDDFADRVLKPLLGPIEELYTQAQQQQNGHIVTEIRGFFKGHKEYTTVYGDEKSGISDQQRKNREELGRLADQIRAGAYSQGVDMTVGEALERANNVLVVDHIGEIERQKIINSVRKRQKSVGSRPSSRKRDGSTNKARSRKKAEKAYAELAAKFGID